MRYEYNGVEYDTEADVFEAMQEQSNVIRPKPEVWGAREDPGPTGLLDLKALRSEPLPPREWLENGIFEMNAVNKLTAASGSGKSLLLLHMAVNWSLGRSALDIVDGKPRKLSRPLRVLYVDGELGPYWWHKYLDKVGAPMDLPDFHVRTLTDDAPTWESLCSPIGAAQFRDWITQVIDEIGDVDVVVMDTLSAFVGGEENSNDTWADFDRLVTLELKKRGLTLIYADHTGHSNQRARGGSAKKAKLDVEQVLAVPDPENAPNELELYSDPARGKMRNGHDGHPSTVYLTRVDTPVLGHVRREAPISTKQAPGARIPGEILALLRDPDNAEGLTSSQIEDGVTGKGGEIRQQIEIMLKANQIKRNQVRRSTDARKNWVYTATDTRTPAHTYKVKNKESE